MPLTFSELEHPTTIVQKAMHTSYAISIVSVVYSSDVYKPRYLSTENDYNPFNLWVWWDLRHDTPKSSVLHADYQVLHMSALRLCILRADLVVIRVRLLGPSPTRTATSSGLCPLVCLMSLVIADWFCTACSSGSSSHSCSCIITLDISRASNTSAQWNDLRRKRKECFESQIISISAYYLIVTVRSILDSYWCYRVVNKNWNKIICCNINTNILICGVFPFFNYLNNILPFRNDTKVSSALYIGILFWF